MPDILDEIVKKRTKKNPRFPAAARRAALRKKQREAGLLDVVGRTADAWLDRPRSMGQHRVALALVRLWREQDYELAVMDYMVY